MKIENDAQYFGTRRSAQGLEEAVAGMLDREREWIKARGAASAPKEGGNEGADADAEREAFIRRGIQSGIESELHCRYRDLDMYDADRPDLRAGRMNEFGHDPGWDLIRSRIAAGFRQADLAEALGISYDEIRGLEAKRYADVSLDMLQRITDAIGARIRIAPPVSLPAAG